MTEQPTASPEMLTAGEAECKAEFEKRYAHGFGQIDGRYPNDHVQGKWDAWRTCWKLRGAPALKPVEQPPEQPVDCALVREAENLKEMLIGYILDSIVSGRAIMRKQGFPVGQQPTRDDAIAAYLRSHTGRDFERALQAAKASNPKRESNLVPDVSGWTVGSKVWARLQVALSLDCADDGLPTTPTGERIRKLLEDVELTHGKRTLIEDGEPQ